MAKNAPGITLYLSAAGAALVIDACTSAALASDPKDIDRVDGLAEIIKMAGGDLDRTKLKTATEEA